MAIPVTATIQAIAEAVKAASKIWYKWLASADKRRLVRRIRRYEKAIDAAERYILLDVEEKPNKEKLKLRYKKIFFKYNQ